MAEFEFFTKLELWVSGYHKLTSVVQNVGEVNTFKELEGKTYWLNWIRTDGVYFELCPYLFLWPWPRQFAANLMCHFVEQKHRDFIMPFANCHEHPQQNLSMQCK